MAVSRHSIDLPHQIHPLDNPAECRKSLTVWVAFATEIELGLNDKKMIALEAYATYERRGVALEPGKH